MVDRESSQKYSDILKIFPDEYQGLGALILGLIALVTAFLYFIELKSNSKKMNSEVRVLGSTIFG